MNGGGWAALKQKNYFGNTWHLGELMVQTLSHFNHSWYLIEPDICHYQDWGSEIANVWDSLSQGQSTHEYK
jgi:hypothetical protein